jgi:hypothetical protein
VEIDFMKELKGMKQMKGQFFLLGAILLCSLFFIGLPTSQVLIDTPSHDLDYVLQNLEKEFPHALNLGLDDGNPRQVMENFTSWTRGLAKGFFMNLSSVWIFAQGDPSTGNVTISVGNYMGSDMSIELYLDSEHKSLFVQDGDSDSVTYSSVGSSYDLSVTFGAGAKNLLWQRDKANLFVLIELLRGDDLARKEIIA